MNKRCSWVFAVVLALFLAGCTASAPKEKKRIVWPLPPEKPRLEWIKNYYSEDDLPKSEGEIFAEGFLGKPRLSFFARPTSVVGDSSRGLIYVADPDLRIVRYFDVPNAKLELLTDKVKFQKPAGLALDSQGRIYVVDSAAKAVHVFDKDHKHLRVFGGTKYFERPARIAVNERLQRCYVSDGAEGKILVFDLNGNFLFEFGALGDLDGAFLAPQGIAIADDDRVFVADQLNARIQVFDADGNFLSKFGKRGDKIYNFEGPKDIAIDSEGHLHVVDMRKSALITYDLDGNLLLYTGDKGPTPKTLGFAVPVGISIDPYDRIYIADSFNLRVSVWQYLSEDYLKKNPLP